MSTPLVPISLSHCPPPFDVPDVPDVPWIPLPVRSPSPVCPSVPAPTHPEPVTTSGVQPRGVVGAERPLVLHLTEEGDHLRVPTQGLTLPSSQRACVILNLLAEVSELDMGEESLWCWQH